MSDFKEYMAGLRARAEAERQAQQQKRPQPARENPDYFRRTKEREGNSEWSGGSMGGGTWAGRSK